MIEKIVPSLPRNYFFCCNELYYRYKPYYLCVYLSAQQDFKNVYILNSEKGGIYEKDVVFTGIGWLS